MSARHPDRARLLGFAGSILGLVILVTQLLVWLPLHAKRSETRLDFRAYFDAAAHVGKGEPPYAECVGYRAGDPPSCYVYPPPLAVALAPVVAWGRSTFQVLWYAVILVAFWAYAFALVRLAGLALTSVHVLTAAAIIQFTPGTNVTMSFGNADFLIWALCALAIGGGRWRPLMGVAAAFKVYPGWVVLASVVKRDKGVSTVLAAALVLAVSVAVVGVAGFRDWFAVLSTLAYGPRVYSNVSVPVVLVRMAALLGYHGGARGFIVGAPFLGVPAVGFAMRNASRALREAGILVASLLLAPLCWWYYTPILLIPAAAWWRARVAIRPSPQIEE